MEKMASILILCSIIVYLHTVAVVHAGHNGTKGPEEMKTWYKTYPHMKQKVTELRFYLHDIVSGPNATNIPIAMANYTTRSPTYFGLIAAIDDLLTSGPSPASEIVGRAQGLFVSAALEKLGFHMTYNFVFTNGKYKGSTLSLIGHNPFQDQYRELPVVGGSGVFRLARGSAMLDTVKYNGTSGDAIVEYNVVVLHYA
ncbi:dirigent protein 22-like [Henckelia pumila]|uniref:dirigent protein 22-like n=1 Tax=Henckelia pumila TaxID=405737 RepID=UPI003C6E39B9